MIRFGFIIENGQIFDTQVLNYKLVRENICGNIIYSIIPDGYKRLYLFEPLLDEFDIDKVFLLLQFNNHLKKQRKNEWKFIDNPYYKYSMLVISNMSVLYDYPAIYLTDKKFTLYKACQKLKRKLV